MFQLKGCGLDACAPSSFLAGSAKSASALKQDATKGVGSRQGASRACHLTCVHPVEARLDACARPGGACIVLPRAAPQLVRPREPREPDTAEDAGGQTDHLGQAYKGGLRKGRPFHKPPSFMNSLNPFIFFNFKVLIWTESSILAQDERWRRA